MDGDDVRFRVKCDRVPRAQTDARAADGRDLTSSDTPLSFFFLFFPLALWLEIADDSNRYRQQLMDRRAATVQSKQPNKHTLDSSVTVERLLEIKTMNDSKSGRKWSFAIQVEVGQAADRNLRTSECIN
ncbi:hypothetical protein PybrP1_012693 [[Pythium] brassicae (nom. inval.)]|nr:hypothetical protein PybrP1_012693 [[Pythium] brassicae (nom. inval.)]